MTKIRDYIVDQKIPENIALLGVKGVGKTSVIRNSFSKEKQKKYYEEANIVIAFVFVPETTDNMMGFYNYLRNAILDGLETVEKYDSELYVALTDTISSKTKQILSRSNEADEPTMRSLLYKTIDLILDKGLRLLIVFDDFERFADSSKIKNAQYKCMRELANSGRISLFISTGQDLTKVSEEMKGSGFENIFRYEELRGIKIDYIEDWVDDITQTMEIELDDDIIDWIDETSGGIPEIIIAAGEVVCQMQKNGIVFDEMQCEGLLYAQIYTLMVVWWEFTDQLEHCIFYELIEGISSDSINRDCLVKKGYLKEASSGEVLFVTPMFEKFVKEERKNPIHGQALQIENRNEDEVLNLGKDIIQKVVQEVHIVMDDKIDDMEERIVGRINETFDSFISALPQKDVFYKNSNGELDFERYSEVISAHICKKLGEKNEQEIWEIWGITPEMWNGYPDVSKNDCAMAYRLTSLVFSEDIVALDYTPVTVMLGNFLEGLLNDLVLKSLRKYLPLTKVRVNARQVYLKDHKGTLMMGGFHHIFKREAVNAKISVSPKYVQLGLDAKIMADFIMKLEECYNTRNAANHPGQITTYQKKNMFIANMFFGDNSMVKVISKLQQL